MVSWVLLSVGVYHIGQCCLIISNQSKAGIIKVFCDRMKTALDELAPGHGIKIQLVEDGSGRGAAFVAAVACRLKAAGD